MGHNFGMRHDQGRRDSRGKACYGYMDYKDDTNNWSRCSVEDFTKQNKRCLKVCNNRICVGNGSKPGKNSTVNNILSNLKFLLNKIVLKFLFSEFK